MAGLVVPRPLLNFIKEPLEEAGDQVSGIDLSVCFISDRANSARTNHSPDSQPCTSVGGHVNRIGLRVKECRGPAHPAALACAKWIDNGRRSPAHPLLMLTGLHGLDVMSPRQRSCRPKSGSTRKRPCFHNWQPYGCESGISRGMSRTGQERRQRAIASTCRSRSRLAGPERQSRTVNHPGRSECLFGSPVRLRRPRRGRVNIEEFLFRHHRGD